MRVPASLLASLVALSVAIVAVPGRADFIVVSNEAGYNPFSPIWWGVTPTQWFAQQLTTGDRGGELQSIDPLTRCCFSSSLVVELRSDAGGGKPGSQVLVTFSPSQFRMLPDERFALAPNTSYWFVIGWPAGPHRLLDWYKTEDPEVEGTGALGPLALSNDQGASWVALPNLDEEWLILTVVTVPEPGATLLGAAALLALSALRRQRRVSSRQGTPRPRSG